VTYLRNAEFLPGADGDLLLMPCLDMVPEHRDDMPLFFTQAAST
jgi:hypothetical protein